MSIRDKFNRDQFSEYGRRTKDTLADGADSALSALEDANMRVRDMADERPLALLAGSFALGLFAGVLLPKKRSGKAAIDDQIWLPEESTLDNDEFDAMSSASDMPEGDNAPQDSISGDYIEEDPHAA